METRKFKIVLHTPVGDRDGLLSVVAQGRKLTGLLEILNHTQALCGSIEKSGECAFDGVFITLMNKTEYRAHGILTERGCDLELLSSRGKYRLTGERIG